jgi:hypothetical protein
MKTRILISLLLVAVVSLLLFALTLPVYHLSKPFNLSRNLAAEEPISSTNPYGCGPKVTVGITFPPYGLVTIYYAESQSTSNVTVWMSSASDDVSAHVGTPNGGTGVTTLNTGADGTYTFVFQACGTSPTVPFSLWGYANYTGPLLE